jgi:hypothetical protein
MFLHLCVSEILRLESVIVVLKVFFVVGRLANVARNFSDIDWCGVGLGSGSYESSAEGG